MLMEKNICVLIKEVTISVVSQRCWCEQEEEGSNDDVSPKASICKGLFGLS